MPISKNYRQMLLKTVVGRQSIQNTVYLALSTTPIDPDLGQLPNEPYSGYGYARVAVGSTASGSTVPNYFPANPTYDDVTGKYSFANDTEIHFHEATGDWGTLAYFALYTSSTGTAENNLVAYGQLVSSIHPTANTIPIIRPGNLKVEEE